MASIYDSIKTAQDMVSEVKAHGLNTQIENICRVQDIFGHSTEGELAELAEKDRDTFYLILKNIWDFERGVRFWNQHTDPNRGIKEQFKEVVKERDELSKTLAVSKKNCLTLSEQLTTKESENRELAEELEAKDLEIIKLKAMLFDLMTESKSKAA